MKSRVALQRAVRPSCLLWVVVLFLVGACGRPAISSGEPATGATADKDNDDPIAVGKKLRPVAIERLDAQGQIKIPGAKLTLVDFGATWCTISKMWLPKLDAIYRRHHTRGFEIVFLSQDDDDAERQVVPFVREYLASFPVARDEGHRLANRWHPPAWQSFFLVDEQGVVRWIHRGMWPGDEQRIEDEIAKVLGPLP